MSLLWYPRTYCVSKQHMFYTIIPKGGGSGYKGFYFTVPLPNKGKSSSETHCRFPDASYELTWDSSTLLSQPPTTGDKIDWNEITRHYPRLSHHYKVEVMLQRREWMSLFVTNQQYLPKECEHRLFADVCRFRAHVLARDIPHSFVHFFPDQLLTC